MEKKKVVIDIVIDANRKVIIQNCPEDVEIDIRDIITGFGYNSEKDYYYHSDCAI